MECRPDGRVLLSGVLQLEDRQWQPVDEDEDVGPTLVVPFDDRELVDGQPVVVLRVREVQHCRLGTADGAVGAAVFHRDAVHEHPVQRPVSLDQRWAFDTGQPPIGLVECIRNEIRVEADKRLAQPPFEHHVVEARVRPLRAGLPISDLRTMDDRVIDL